MLRRTFLRAAAAGSLALAACLGDSTRPETPTPTDPATLTYAPALGVDLGTMTKTASGLYYKDLTVGTGAAVTTSSSVTLDHTGWFPDGTRFSFGPIASQPATGFIAGFTEGLVGMRVGGKRKLVIPPLRGYGLYNARGIPGNSVLVFDVSVTSIP